jgi:hypothetical protein
MRGNLYAIPRIALGAGTSFSAAVAVESRTAALCLALADRLEGIFVRPGKMKVLLGLSPDE